MYVSAHIVEIYWFSHMILIGFDQWENESMTRMNFVVIASFFFKIIHMATKKFRSGEVWDVEIEFVWEFNLAKDGSSYQGSYRIGEL